MTAAAVSALEADWPAVRIGSARVLGPIRLAIEAGCWTAVVGPNGAGKSTLLRTLAGLQATDGSVRLHRRTLAELPARERARQLAWMGQNEGTADGLSAHEVVMLGRLPHRGWLAPPSPADLAAVESAMRRTQCLQWRERLLSTLSGGERQRVLLARALAVGAGVLLLDEPLSHLDPPHQADWIDLVRDEVAAGATVVSVLHELQIALQADRLVVMAGGAVVHQGPAGDPATHDALRAVFDNRLQLVQVDGQWLALPRAAR
ncbi:ABC transporter ATP-binding protein [Piscinibacter sakaiensis]|uniref:ABC transporter ATP-binding protein n=1 Tax=Piscinibacter sakaiensis TaxID=1547922 RepID=UPI003AACBCF8